MVHTSHKLEGLGDEIILALRHLVGNLGVARARALIVELLSRGRGGLNGGLEVLFKLVFAADVRRAGVKAIRWFLVGRAWAHEERVCLGCKAGTRHKQAELRFSGYRTIQFARQEPPSEPAIPRLQFANIHLPEEQPQLSPRRHSRCSPLSLSGCSGPRLA